MNVKAVCSWALVLTVVSLRAASAQDPMRPAYSSPPASTPEAPAADAVPAKQQIHSLSDWITYNRPDCCGPVGRNGPIGTELYAYSGWTLPIAGALFKQRLETGWNISGGARILLFNPEVTAAWTADLGLLSTYNHGQRDDLPITLFLRDTVNAGQFIRRDVTIRSYHRTFVTAALGREWFLTGPIDNCHWNWRAGLDLGGRYGTSRVDLDEFQQRSFFRRNDVVGSFTLAVHTDVEIPHGCCTFLTGFRAEYAYTWSDIFQEQNHADLQEIGLALKFGVRF